MDARSTQLAQWLAGLGYRDYQLAPASEDASFRRYLRLSSEGRSLIVMDAPPDKETCEPYIRVAAMLRDAGLSAPEVIAQDLDRGFLLLTDFGNASYLSCLDPGSEAALYADALDALLVMQCRIDGSGLPPYDEALLRREMGLFHDWFLGELLEIELVPDLAAAWNEAVEVLVDNALAQPRVFVHRDYHSRNLMKLEAGNPGILDFQDAVFGPVTYDLVSLLRDCYIAWPPARVDQLALDYHARARDAGLVDVGAAQFLHWFNLTGAQRHLKAIGIFARLWLRDGKRGYLGDIPRTLTYLQQVSSDEMLLEGLADLIEALALPLRAESAARA